MLYDEDGNEISIEDLEGLMSEEELQAMLAEESDDEEEMDLDELSMGDDYSCSLQQTLEVAGDGWTDTVLVTITAQKMEEGKAFLYASVERDRHYE